MKLTTTRTTTKKTTRNKKASRPIGVFDSGLGGLTIVREIRRQMPQEPIVYFGDMARLPYGTKSKEQIQRFSVQNTLFLIGKKVKAVVIACNSSSSAAYLFIKRHFRVPVIDVIEPAAQEAVRLSQSKRIAVLATQATIESRAYDKALTKQSSRVRTVSQSCPLFVPIVEEGWVNGKITGQIIENYIGAIKKSRPDVLILGCTHYPLLRGSIQKAVGRKVTLVDSAAPTVQRLHQTLTEKGLLKRSGKKGKLEIYLSDKPRNFLRVGEKFLGEKMTRVTLVRPK